MQKSSLIKEIFRYTAPKYSRLSKAEAEILDTAITVKGGNAYSLWKASALKHYPTVLRTLKKLEEKRLVEKLSESGTRGERIYAPTLFGTLVYYTHKEDENKLIEIVTQNSSRLQEMLTDKADEAKGWGYSIVRNMASDIVSGRLRTIDEIVKETISGSIRDRLLNIQYQEDRDKLIKLTRVEWIKELAIQEIQSEIEWCKKQVQELSKIKEVLTTT